ncbi:MAG: bifunctional nuclease family protein [Planctomycetota bacterium]
MEVRMELARVVISETSDQQVIYLREKDGERTFPIIIGIFEAVSIDRSLKGQTLPRPLTHDLAVGIINEMGGKLERIVVDDLVEEDKRGTFHAKLHISRDGEDVVVDARPSDAIAIAVRVNCPVFVDDSVLDKVASG